MPVLGLTGGIAAGKSSVTALLAKQLKAQVFDSDACARSLAEEDAGVRASLRERFGPDLFTAERKLDRKRLREEVFTDDSARRALESIFHPIIRARWMAIAEQFREAESWLIVDIPLLFETGAESAFPVTLAVLCSRSTQMERLTGDRGLDPEIAAKMIASQWPSDRKIGLADHVIWNDGTRACLDSQAARCAAILIQKYERGP